jgi:uncharacterized protein (DUF488 family)
MILGLVTVHTIGHGTRPLEELLECLREARVETLVDVRRFPGSRHNPQFGQEPLRKALETTGIAYRHEVELGGRRADEPDEERFSCIRTAAFRSYAARMARPEWQDALGRALAEPAPCFMCAETPWWRCHRSLIAELLAARGHTVVHLVRPGERLPHRPSDAAEYRGGKLFLCGHFVA